LKSQLATYLLTLAEGEEKAEEQRQKLCADSAFETYAAFSRIDRQNHGLITSKEILEFLRSADMAGVMTEADCQVLV
jgi:Ca2+-binding EF-hand superfamily protein